MKRFSLFFLLMLTLCLLALSALAEDEVVTTIEISDTERFVILRREGSQVLCHQVLENKAWHTDAENDHVFQGLREDAYGWYGGGGFSEAVRFAEQAPEHVVIYAGEEHPCFNLELYRDERQGWRVAMYGSDAQDLFAYLRPECLLIYADDFSAQSLAGISYDTDLDTTFAGFNPDQLAQKRDALAKACEKASMPIEYFAGCEPLYIAPGEDTLLPVYVTPYENAPRSAHGKASVSLNDWLCILCKEGDSLMVLYETTPNHFRTGWISPSGIQCLEIAAAYTPEAVWETRPDTHAVGPSVLFDDPINRTGTVCLVPDDASLPCLFHLSPTLNYVEYRTNTQVWRGFIGELSNG